MNSVFQKMKLIKDIILKKEIYYPIQIKYEKKWIGSKSCGFYIIPEFLSDNSVVYSLGVGENISFDEELMNIYKCNIYAYDPTPKSNEYINSKKIYHGFYFFNYAIADYDGYMNFYLPENPNYVSGTIYNRWGYDESKNKPIKVIAKRIKTIMNENGHTHIDLLKMDIEGSEYTVIDDILQNNIKIKQLLVEVHHRFSGIGIKKTKKLISHLNTKGYYIAAISPSREEYTFIHK